MQIDHLGYAVKNIEKARKALETLGFVFSHPAIEDRDRNIRIQFGEKDGYRLELVAPAGEDHSPVDTILHCVGPTPYHICYGSDNLGKDIKELEEKGFKLIISPAQATAFGGRRVAFMMNRGIGLIELAEFQDAGET